MATDRSTAVAPVPLPEAAFLFAAAPARRHGLHAYELGEHTLRNVAHPVLLHAIGAVDVES